LSPLHLRSVVQNPQMGAALSVIGEVRSQAETLISEINREVYRLYEAIPAKEALDGTWFPLLRGPLDLAERVEIFTTNYDRSSNTP